jgi:Rap1a immunity proteins
MNLNSVILSTIEDQGATREEASANTTNAMVLGPVFRNRWQGKFNSTKFMYGNPKGVTPQQLVDVVVKFGEEHPEITHEPFVLLTLVAINETWPCKK